MTDTGADARDLLARRARHLARPLAERELTASEGDAASLLVIRVGAERIGVPLDHIIEVHRSTSLTSIPGAALPVLGVIAWRGRVLTVLDIAHDRNGPSVLSDTTRILVLGQRRASFGIVADDVEDVQDVALGDTASLDDVAPTRSEFVRGVMADALIVLDVAALIARFASTH
jgi:purine-binding chemotaxis protein CheW